MALRYKQVLLSLRFSTWNTNLKWTLLWTQTFYYPKGGLYWLLSMNLISVLKKYRRKIKFKSDFSSRYNGYMFFPHNLINFDGLWIFFAVIDFAKLYILSTLNTDYLLWHTQLIVCAVNIKSWVIIFTFQVFRVKKHS